MVAEMIDYQAIRERITLEEASRWLGFTPQSGFIDCPFHKEKTPSLKLYENRFHCFGCGASGDVTDFAAEVLGIPMAEAAQKLMTAFYVPETVRTLRLPNSDNQTRKAQLLGAWKVAAYDELCESTRVCLMGMNSTDPEAQELGSRQLKRAELIAEEFLEKSAAELFERYSSGTGKEEMDAVIRIGRRYKELSGLCNGNQLAELEKYIIGIMAGNR
jgi:hypothetical protein